MRAACILLASLLVPATAHAWEVSAEAAAAAFPTGPASSVSGRLTGDRGAFLAAEARGVVGQGVSQRATAGLDLFPGKGFDLTLGLFLGAAGTLEGAHLEGGPMAGLEVGLGVKAGPLHLRYRHAAGERDWRGECATCTDWTEDGWRLSFFLADRVGLFGEVLRLTPCPDPAVAATGYGIGASLTF